MNFFPVVPVTITSGILALYSGARFDKTASNKTYSSNMSVYGVEVPLEFAVRYFNPQKPEYHGANKFCYFNGLFLGIGVFARYYLGGNIHQSLPDPGNTFDRSLNLGNLRGYDFRPFDFGGTVRAGWQFEGGLCISLSGQKGVINLNPRQNIDSHGAGAITSTSASLSINYIMCGRRKRK